MRNRQHRFRFQKDAPPPRPKGVVPGADFLWTRSQTIRTAGETPFEAALLDTEPPPIYQRISQQAAQLQALGLSLSCIARQLGVNDKTAAKAVQWVERMAQDRQR